ILQTPTYTHIPYTTLFRSLDLTAEMIRFSPFGKADRAGQEPSGQTSYGQASTPSSYNSPSTYSEPSYTSQSTGNTGYSSYPGNRSEEHTSELQSRENLVCR